MGRRVPWRPGAAGLVEMALTAREFGRPQRLPAMARALADMALESTRNWAQAALEGGELDGPGHRCDRIPPSGSP